VTPVDTEVLVIGSGAGGATTARGLAEAGVAVHVVEEGPWLEPGEVPPFSLQEMDRAYRHRGSSAAMGRPPIAYAEGCCVGGSTEINSGLWARLPDALVDDWSRNLGLDDLTSDDLRARAERIESWVPVNGLPGPVPASSAALARGADALGWRSEEFPRAFTYDGTGHGTKQSMTQTLLPEAARLGATIDACTAVTRLRLDGGRARGAQVVTTHPDGGREIRELHAEHVFVCGGAIQTPALLQRSGLRRRPIGRGLRMHPTLKVAARFPTAVDHDEVPVHRITEFAPELAIGGSASRRGQVGLALADSGVDIHDLGNAWQHVFVYYAAIKSDRGGRVTAVPGLRSPVVTYPISDADLSRLARGLILLGEALFAAGAEELYPTVEGAPVATSVADLGAWWEAIDRRRASLMSVHLTSSIGMSHDPVRTGADAHGRVWGIDGLYVNDASLLPDAPGVNPQAGVMAIALRNVDHFLASTRR
jgi:choline dehydrogenase-like flavoprotein